MIKSNIVLALLLSSFAAVSFAQPAATDMPASAPHHAKKMHHHKHAMGAASAASGSMK